MNRQRFLPCSSLKLKPNFRKVFVKTLFFPTRLHVFGRQVLKLASLLQIEYLARHNIPYLATKPGGHGNVPTLGAYRSVVQINLDKFRDAFVNSDYSITIGGGAKMVDLIPTLHTAGREMSKLSSPTSTS